MTRIGQIPIRVNPRQNSAQRLFVVRGLGYLLLRTQYSVLSTVYCRLLRFTATSISSTLAAQLPLLYSYLGASRHCQQPMRRPLLLALSILLIAAIGGIFWLRSHSAASRRLAAWQEQQQAAATRDILNRLVTLEGGPMSLGEFAVIIEKESGLKVAFDEPALAITRHPVQPAATIPVHVPKATLTLQSALRLALGPQGLAADVLDNTVLITTWDHLYDRLRVETVVYPLPLTGPAGMNEEDWREMIAGNLFHPAVPSGYTGLTTHVEAVLGALIVVHTPDGHRRVRQIIDAICKLGESKPVHSPITIPPPHPGTMERQILAALDHPATLDLVEMPLSDVIGYLADQHGIPILLMVPKLAEAGIPADTPITRKLKGISLRSALRLLLTDLDLTFTLRDEVLLITTPEDAENEEITVAYPVQDLVWTDVGPDFDPLIDLITMHIMPTHWSSGSGPSPIQAYGDGLLVFPQDWDFHQEVNLFLTHLRQILASSPSRQVVSVVANHDSEQKLHAALEKALALDFQNVPLRKAALKLQEELGIPILLAFRKLEEASVSPDTPVTCISAGAPARQQLRALLEPLALTYVIRDEVLHITTPEDGESQLRLKLYDIRDLQPADAPDAKLDQQIMQKVDPGNWDVAGGPGTISVYRGILVVSATEPSHQEIEKWLADFRAKQASSTPSPEKQ